VFPRRKFISETLEDLDRDFKRLVRIEFLRASHKYTLDSRRSKVDLDPERACESRTGDPHCPDAVWVTVAKDCAGSISLGNQARPGVFGVGDATAKNVKRMACPVAEGRRLYSLFMRF